MTKLNLILSIFVVSKLICKLRYLKYTELSTNAKLAIYFWKLGAILFLYYKLYSTKLSLKTFKQRHRTKSLQQSDNLSVKQPLE